MNFDRLAPYYPWIEAVLAGGIMQRCRMTFLARTKDCRHALLAGEGTGKFLVELLRFNPQIRVTCLEQSAAMIGQICRRLNREQLDFSRVQFEQKDILGWTPPGQKFDLIATNFFLDCFQAEELQKIVCFLAAGATPDAIWLLADFREPEHGWRRWRARMILDSLYAFFKFSTALSASRLTPPDQFLSGAGFELAERRLASFGMVHADFWRRKFS